MFTRKMQRRAWPLIVLCSLACAASAQAQEIYRGKTRTGSTIYSDQNLGSNAKPVDLSDKVTVIHTRAQPDTELPFRLRETSARFPVVLYTRPECSPCDSARQLLVQRGVPFEERTVNTPQEHKAYAALGYDVYPTATIGQQLIKGFNPADMNQYLTAAGYPQTSQLPSGYANPVIAPIAVSPEAAAEAQPGEAGQTPAAAPVTGETPPPAGQADATTTEAQPPAEAAPAGGLRF